ncbi:hypothetical protein CA267_006645 [Alteromonas pelagimontana]|uniref:Uncharacterized protein n=1 Tax=Alteromonas pelagimontana TaxID=1858656 RepID=A0A6M4MB88_9ALTE|nr:hypothetical protein [Alteromonas pelagimontana]QJR80474.1 hypothetical protein CA267_006645 [Alteromonas pelagimontana]
MIFEQEVSVSLRAFIGLVTSAISLAFLSLIGFFLITSNGRFSLAIFIVYTILALLAFWFGRISYQLIVPSSKNKAYLFSPLSVLCIFSLFGLGTMAGTVFSFLTGGLENGFLSLLLLCLLLPVGDYCWKIAKKRAGE